MTLSAIFVVFGVVFLAELPDKTMFASLLLAARGRLSLVWIGVAAAFAVHVAIAVTIGGTLLTLLPHRITQILVSAIFVLGALLALRDPGEEHESGSMQRFVGHKTVITSFLVIFIAEWGDLTQLLTANLAARYHAPLQVGIAAVLALWAVAGLATAAGRLARRLPVQLLRRITAAVLLVLAALAALDAATGINVLGF